MTKLEIKELGSPSEKWVLKDGNPYGTLSQTITHALGNAKNLPLVRKELERIGLPYDTLLEDQRKCTKKALCIILNIKE